MSHTTTDAAEARAETGIERARRRRAERDASGVLYVDSSIYEGMEACLVRNGRTVAHVHRYADAVEIAAGLATAEAASGAGEREDDAPSRIWLCGYDTDHGDISWSSEPNPTGDPEVDGRQVAYVRASLPPATDPAMGLDPVTVGRCVAMCEQLANGCRAELKDPANDARTISILDGYIGACTTLARNVAALAAAPTIPATGEAGQ